MDLDRNRFEKAKKGRDTIIHHAMKSYKYKVYDPPEIVMQKECHKTTEEQVKNRKEGKDFNKVWDEIVDTQEETMKEVVNIGNGESENKKLPIDGKDWSLSTEGFQIFISGENKDVVNKDAYKDENEQQLPKVLDEEESKNDSRTSEKEGENNEEIEVEEEDSDSDFSFEEHKTNNIQIEGIENLTLETLKARPDKIIHLSLLKVTATNAEITWKIPDCNNSEIIEYTIK